MHLDDLARRALALLESAEAHADQGERSPHEIGATRQPRIILAIAGSPGSGKTTLATALADRVNTLAGHPRADAASAAEPSAEPSARHAAALADRVDTLAGHPREAAPFTAVPFPEPAATAGTPAAERFAQPASTLPAEPATTARNPATQPATRQPAAPQRAAAPLAVHLPMDGFHLANATLDALNRHDRKGAIDTFDAWGYLGLLARIAAERDHVVYAPGFDRRIDEPVAGQIAVAPDARLIVTEGNYLLVDQSPWSLARAFYAETWFVAAPEPERMRRLVARHTLFGRSELEARRWAETVDGVNAALIESFASRADLVIDRLEGIVITS